MFVNLHRSTTTSGRQVLWRTKAARPDTIEQKPIKFGKFTTTVSELLGEPSSPILLYSIFVENMLQNSLP